jgi:tripartite-type tricarboxylate transporter receptor subunit TctC
MIRDGKILAIAVSSARRAAALPNVPTTIEAGVPDSDFDFWVGAVVPKKTPREIVARMHAEIVKALNDPSTKEKLSKIGVEQMIMEPAAFDARIEKEVDMARKLAKAANIQPQ